MVANRSMLAAAGVVLLALEAPASFAYHRPVQLAPFSAIEIRHGGHAVVRQGSAQRVSFVQGSAEHTRMAVTNGVLVIDKCPGDCPRGYRLEVEVIMPAVTRLSLANGGRIQTRGSFPRQQDFVASVAHGGTVDVRSLAVDRVSASVEHGGRILTVPRASLSARVTQGGVITYWGNAQVRSSIQHGGVVHKGEPGDIDEPLSDAGFSFPPPLRRH